MARIFLSYRRENAGGHPRHMFENLVARHGEKSIFKDVETIAGGEDFVERIHREVGQCDIIRRSLLPVLRPFLLTNAQFIHHPVG